MFAYISGKLTVWAVAKLFEAIRYSALVHGFGLYDRLKTKDRSIFMASVRYDFTENINNLTAREVSGMKYPLLARLSIANIGKSSFTFATDVYKHKTDEKIINAYMTFVYVDFKTRKPAAFPPWVGEAAKSKQFIKPLGRLLTPEVPATAYTYSTRAFASDIDFNGHVNQSIYVKWCSDAGTDAALKGRYSGFTQDLGKYPTKQISVKYIGEGFQGDQFVVNTWLDETDKNVLHFVITRDNGVVFVSRFSYFTCGLSSKL